LSNTATSQTNSTAYYRTEAYERLRSLIVRGRLAPGTRIVERELARRLDVSRTPIRSALQRLQQEGYVTVINGQGQNRLSVAPLTTSDARELFSIVANVEGMAGALAARLADAERTSLVERLRSINARLLSAAEAENPDRNELFELDRDFHRAYVATAAGPRLLGLHDSIKPQLDRYNRLYAAALASQIRTSVDEHEDIVQSIVDREPERAEEHVKRNFRNAGERLSEVIASVGEWGSW